jgi:hypothetical protein
MSYLVATTNNGISISCQQIILPSLLPCTWHNLGGRPSQDMAQWLIIESVVEIFRCDLDNHYGPRRITSNSVYKWKNTFCFETWTSLLFSSRTDFGS